MQQPTDPKLRQALAVAAATHLHTTKGQRVATGTTTASGDSNWQHEGRMLHLALRQQHYQGRR